MRGAISLPCDAEFCVLTFLIMRREGAFKASLLLEPALSIGCVSGIHGNDRVCEISTDRATESLHTSGYELRKLMYACSRDQAAHAHVELTAEELPRIHVVHMSTLY